MTEVYPDGICDGQPTGADDDTEPAASQSADQATRQDTVVRLPIDPAEPMADWLAII